MYRLRELESKDLSTINKWRNNPDLIQKLGAPFRYINLEVDQNWFQSYMNNRSTAVRCAIVDSSDDMIIGLVSLVSINHLNQSAQFHIMIGGAENRGKGAGSFATKTMLEHAFFNLNLQRVKLEVLDDNKEAQHLYEKCGFVFEGKKRKACYKNGRFVDTLVYSILKEEYKK